ncbi:hypothetical protein TCAL_11624 [Tigriopus californicus]|uniref:Uncharacterized protein n=2 Tax=Tigriopus californicus TaxID=6832 RepID=A0A553P025_TIGCA|nr:hypothetical protein TCAL_11624 [Tigriopus californicus]|eukprot:TCALIF_11624-PA protein Name:"Similar to MIMI_R665 Uncharacterized protein R665 (Acanthamoeba polyphaga mimivirus)" AED:0.17 eAED:0.17 QI:0/-1/0/1/-1/1/1/0/524
MDKLSISSSNKLLILDCRNLEASQIIPDIKILHEDIMRDSIKAVWLDTTSSRFIEIKERLKKLSMATSMFHLMKLSLQARETDLQEAQKTSQLIASIPTVMEDLPNLSQNHPGLVRYIRLACKQAPISSMNPQPSTGVKRKNADCYGDGRRAKRSTFNTLGNFSLSKSKCYMCRCHSDLDRLCSDCMALNDHYLTTQVDLIGRKAIVTGGRIKIGFETVLRLLRDGCQVTATTRFPLDALKRYQDLRDYSMWKDRLKIAYLNLEDFESIKTFLDHVQGTMDHLDILINNAAQTIHRPLGFYQQFEAMEAAEVQDRACLSIPRPKNAASQMRSLSWSIKETTNNKVHFPHNQLDEHGQPLDLRPRNSWTYNLDEVPLQEMLQVLAINTVGPFILTSQLKPLLRKSPFQRKFVINVSAMEGQFSRHNKGQRHPHTNMAKAALNMMTRTSGLEFQLDGIFMTAVDTGWVTDERPHAQAVYEADRGFTVPLNCRDGAARVYQPVIHGLSPENQPYFAVFLKNYKVHPW